MSRQLVLPPLEERPLCSIIIPCLDEETYVESVVRAAMEQRYPASQLEILVADGGSSDRTRGIIERLSSEDPRVVLVDNPGRFPSAGLNAAIRRARGSVIVRMDAHAEFAPDYVSASVEALRRTGAANAGGAARTRARSRFQRALCAALSSPLGVGGSAYRDPSREGFVESVWGGAFRREAFEQVGLFDAEARANEDAELNQRIIEAGGTIYLSREVVAYYYPRGSLLALFRQYFAYGEGRARTLLRRGRVLSPRPLVPFAAVTGFALLLALGIAVPRAWPLPAIAALLYAAGVTAESIRVARRHGPGVFPRLLLIFPTMHAAHGLGVWAGLLRHAWTGLPRDEPERLPAR
jgi:cellulose synthase/poly-beta-1,6-N-acetylglucosamine synthase-like glycosyltransferase